jgi:hypothetical protein
MVSNIFWGLVILDTVAMGVLAYLASRGPSGPEGPVGAWLLFIPPVLMIILVAAVLVTKAEPIKMAGIAFLGFPWIAVAIGPVYSKLQDYQTTRSIAGDNDFHGVARQLAHAITARDSALVKTLIPKVGDLNQSHGETTFLLFALDKATDPGDRESPTSPASIEIVRSLLDAGAKADHPGPYQRWPLVFAMQTGPELTEMLLKAGADPNRLDDVERPMWWHILSNDSDRGIQTLKVLLNHGADVTLRHSEGGPIGWAAHHARASYCSSWRGVGLLIDHGASWQDERQFGQPVADLVASDVAQRRNKDLPEQLRRLVSLYGLAK